MLKGSCLKAGGKCCRAKWDFTPLQFNIFHFFFLLAIISVQVTCVGHKIKVETNQAALPRCFIATWLASTGENLLTFDTHYVKDDVGRWLLFCFLLLSEILTEETRW